MGGQGDYRVILAAVLLALMIVWGLWLYGYRPWKKK